MSCTAWRIRSTPRGCTKMRYATSGSSRCTRRATGATSREWGACLFMAKRFAEAVVVYSFLARLEPADPEVLCMCGHSLLMRGEVKDARVCLDYAAGLPDPSGEFHQRAKALLELISQA